MRETKASDGLGVADVYEASLVPCVQAGGPTDSPTAPALERLCQAYWQPLFHYTRRQGYSAHDAQDLTQGFFERLLRTDALSTMRQEQAGFRSFMLAALQHYLSDERDRSKAQKRGGDQKRISFDQTAENLPAMEGPDGGTRDAVCDHEWAVSVVQEAMKNLAGEYVRADRHPWLVALSPLLSREAEPGEYAQLATELHTSEGSVAVAVHRLRKRYRECIRREVARTITGEQVLDDEMKYLFRALAARGA